MPVYYKCTYNLITIFTLILFKYFTTNSSTKYKSTEYIYLYVYRTYLYTVVLFGGGGHAFAPVYYLAQSQVGVLEKYELPIRYFYYYYSNIQSSIYITYSDKC